MSEILSSATVSYLRVTPRKARLVADIIRGKNSEDALRILRVNRKKCSRDIEKLLMSAIANASQKGVFDVDATYVSSIMINQGPVLKRSLPRARGSATPILKRTSHVILTLSKR